MSFANLQIHALLPRTRANGPGLRSAIWLQGCTLGCPGCFNPDTHSPTGGRRMAIEALLAWVTAQAGEVEGITLTGGEPLQQAEALLPLLQSIRQATDLGVLISTGYDWPSVLARPGARALLPLVDAIVAGPYISQEHYASGYRGSANKTVHCLTSRYTPDDLAAVPPIEAFVSGAETVWTGLTAPDGPGYLHPIAH